MSLSQITFYLKALHTNTGVSLILSDYRAQAELCKVIQGT